MKKCLIFFYFIMLHGVGYGEVFAEKRPIHPSVAIATEDVIADYDNLRAAVWKNLKWKSIMPALDILLMKYEIQRQRLSVPDYINVRTAVFVSDEPYVKRNMPVFIPEFVKLVQNLSVIDDPLKKAIIIRNHVFSHITLMLPEDYPRVPLENLCENYVYSYKNKEYGHLCGGLTILFQSICEAFEIPTRYVGLFDEIDYDYNSHATAEVFYNGKWIVMDPTFNVMAKYDGEYISYAELRVLASEGKSNDVTWDSNGYDIPDIRKIQNYYIGMDKLTNYIAIQKARVRHNDEIIEYDRKAIPATWDMTVWNGEYLLGTAGEDIYYHFSWGEYRFRDMELMTAEKVYVPESGRWNVKSR